MRDLPLIVDIKRGSHEDGPGIRSVVFFKGCPLRCIFCQNIEAQEIEAEIAFFARKCIKCERCVDACPQGAIDMDFPGRIHRDRCDRCGKCVEACSGAGLRIVGTYYPVEILIKLLLQDKSFYHHSGGGVTLSGGECTLYPNYLEFLLKGLKAEEIHIALETSGYFDYALFNQKILPHLDLIYYDVKFADPEAHRKYTGKPNEKILSNLRQLLRENGAEIHPRIPLIPGITASRENLSGIIDLLCGMGASDVSLLPYNPMGMEMAPKLGKPKPPLPESFMNPDKVEKIYSMFGELIEAKEVMSTSD